MQEQAAAEAFSRRRRCLFALVLLGLLMLPVEYRAGAEVQHAHASFQLWRDVARGAVDHHDHAHDGGHEAAVRHGSRPGAAAERSAAVTAAASDLPRLSELVPSAERLALLLVVAASALAFLVGGGPADLLPPGALVGLRRPPGTPPPQSLAASH